MRASRLTPLGLVAGLLLAACGGTTTAYPAGAASPSSDPPAYPSSPAVTASPSAPAKTGATVGVAARGALGRILVDGQGRTMYLFMADNGMASVCYGTCAVYWPPVLTRGAPQAGAGVNAKLLGSTRRTDGTTEVTYAGHPLYYYIADKKAGDTLGQGVDGFGGPWYVVGPSGQRIDLS